jgi:hypothetical protein
MKQILFIIALLWAASPSFGQGLQLATMRNIGQTNLVNPASQTDQKFFIGGAFQNGIGTNFAGAKFYRNDLGLSPIYVNPDDLKENQFFSLNTSVPLMVGFKVKDWKVMLHTQTQFATQAYFNKDVIALLMNGNAPYVGQTMTLDPGFSTSLYQEVGVGVSRSFLKIFTFGARVKLLGGFFNLETQDGELSIYTDDENYALTGRANYLFRSAGLSDLSSIDEGTFVGGNLFDNSTFTQNTGVAFDLGATMNINDRLEVGLSVLDLGAIRWKEGAYTYNVKGEFTFSGIDAAGFLTGSDIGNPLDSLEGQISFNSSDASYSSALTPKIYATGRFGVTESFDVTGVVRAAILDEGAETAIGIGVQKQFGKVLGLGAMYSIQNGSFANIGINMSLKLGPIQGFFIVDNLLSNPTSGNIGNTGFWMGGNIAF